MIYQRGYAYRGNYGAHAIKISGDPPPANTLPPLISAEKKELTGKPLRPFYMRPP